jgi:hypothetical protein
VRGCGCTAQAAGRRCKALFDCLVNIYDNQGSKPVQGTKTKRILRGTKMATKTKWSSTVPEQSVYGWFFEYYDIMFFGFSDLVLKPKRGKRNIQINCIFLFFKSNGKTEYSSCLFCLRDI